MRIAMLVIWLVIGVGFIVAAAGKGALTRERIAMLLMWLIIAVGLSVAAAGKGVLTQEEGGPGLVVVVDSKGKEIGPYLPVRPDLPGESVLRKINGLWFLLPVSRDGFNLHGRGINLFYSEANCSGPPFLIGYPPPPFSPPPAPLALAAKGPPINPGIANGILYYPEPGSLKKRNLISRLPIGWDGKAGECTTHYAPGVFPSWAVAKFDLSRLGVPPFSLAEKRQ